MKKTLVGAGLAALGFTTIMISPYAGAGWFGVSFPWSIVVYTVVFLLGFVSMLYGAGLVLMENDLWG